jgi:hypothetical protein
LRSEADKRASDATRSGAHPSPTPAEIADAARININAEITQRVLKLAGESLALAVGRPFVNGRND